MTKLKTYLIHLKILLFGDKELFKNGKMIPCKKCDKLFMSYPHWGEFFEEYDSLCPECLSFKSS